MPGLAPDARARVLERLLLESLVRQADLPAPGQEALAIRRHEVRHWPAKPDVAVEPEPPVHRVDHPVATSREFAGMEVSRGVAAGHGPTIHPGLLTEQLAFDGGRRHRSDRTDEHRALDWKGQRVRDLG